MCHDLDSSPPIARISGAAVSHDDLVLEAVDGNRFAAFAATPDEPAAAGVVILPDVRGLYGFYLGVVREGEVEAGDSIVELVRDPRGFRVTEIARLYTRDRDDAEGMQRAANLDVLPQSWRSYFRTKVYGRA